MGQEAVCVARYSGQVSQGKAKLEADSLLFRGDFRLLIRLAEVSKVRAAAGRLEIVWPQGSASFELGALANQWAARIRSPKSTLDKLGVKPGAKVVLHGIEDPAFLHQLAERRAEVVAAGCGADLVFVGVEERRDLSALDRARKSLASAGALWMVFPKGRQHIKEADVLAAGKRAGLVDVKVVSFSSTHTALKFVVPVKNRPR